MRMQFTILNQLKQKHRYAQLKAVFLGSAVLLSAVPAGVLAHGVGGAVILSGLEIGPTLGTSTSGILNELEFAIDADITNMSGLSWDGLYVRLNQLDFNGNLVPSTSSDAISFQEGLLTHDWEHDVSVSLEINGVHVSQGPADGSWDVTRSNSPYDELLFSFNGFNIDPLANISLIFGMSNYSGDYFTLDFQAVPQVQAVPVPAALPLFLSGATVMFVALRRKKEAC